MALSALLFAGLFGSALILALVRHPIFGLYAYLLAFYGYPPERWWGAYLPDLRWSLLAAAVALIAALKMQRQPDQTRWYANPATVAILVFTAWLWVQGFWALAPSDHSFLVSLFAKYIVLLYILYRILVDEEAVKQFAMAHVLGCAYYGWVAFNTASGGRFEYVGGPNMDGSSAFSAQMATALFFGGILLFRTRGALRLVVLLCLPLILNGMILSENRGAFVGLIAGGLAVIYLVPKVYRKTCYAAGGLAVVLLLVLASESFLERMGTITDAVGREEQIDGSAESRWILWEAQWEMFKLSPVLGTGHRGTVVLSPAYLDERWLSDGGRSSHNTTMTLLVEQGLAGSVIVLGLGAWAARRLLRLKSLDKHGLSNELGLQRAAIGGALVSLFAAGQFSDLLRLEIWIWCLMMLAVVDREARKEVPHPGGGRRRPAAATLPRTRTVQA